MSQVKTPEIDEATAIAAAAALAAAKAEEELYGEFSMTPVRKVTGKVITGTIPVKLAEMLAVHAPKALADPDYELILTAKDAATAKRLGLYARAWGAQQEPKLYIHKVPNRRDMKDNVARLAVEKDEDVPAENRPGRRA